jgi:hypothetical protein
MSVQWHTIPEGTSRPVARQLNGRERPQRVITSYDLTPDDVTLGPQDIPLDVKESGPRNFAGQSHTAAECLICIVNETGWAAKSVSNLLRGPR